MSQSPLTDDALDQELRDVALPAGLMDRLRQTARWADGELDMELAFVPMPPGMLERIQRLASEPSRRLERVALAASLLLAVTLVFGGMMATHLTLAYRAAQPQRMWLDSQRPGDRVQFTASVAHAAISNAQTDVALADVPEFAVQQSPEIELAAVERQPPIPTFPSPFPAAERPVRFGRTSELNLEQFGAVLLGSPQLEEEMPELRLLPPLVRRGIALPTGGYTTRAPLWTGQESFLLARRSLAEGEMPLSEIVRPEEFVAAVDYRFHPRPPQGVGLHVAGGPSPMGQPQQLLLQVAVRAAEVADAPRKPVHLIICVDVAASMQRGARLEMVQQALSSLAGRLQRDDRLSLLAIGDGAQTLIEQAGRQDASSWQAAVEALQTQTLSNPVAGLWSAYGLAAEATVAAERTQHVLLFSDNLVRVEDLATLPLDSYLRGGAANLARLWLVDLAQIPVMPDHWQRLAKAGKGQVRSAGSTDEIRWTVLEALMGKSQRVASNVALSVSFHPSAVAGYRLVGHEPGLLAATPQTELRSGQTSLALYEIQLKPKPGDQVATVNLSWRDAASGERRTQSQTLTRGHFAKSFASEPASLQLATLAAEMAELLRHSPLRQSSSFQQWKKLAAEVNPQTAKNESFEELARLVRQAERARPTSPRLKQLWMRQSGR
jgi:hypothetical protein